MINVRGKDMWEFSSALGVLEEEVKNAAAYGEKQYNELIAETNRAIQVAKDDYARASSDHALIQEVRHHNQQVLERTKSELGELQRQVECLKRDMERCQQEIARLTYRRNALAKPSSNNCTPEEYETRRSAYQAEVNNYNARIRFQEQEKDKIRRMIEQKQHRIAALTTHCNRVQNANYRLDGLARTVEQSMQALRNYLEQLQDQHGKLEYGLANFKQCAMLCRGHLSDVRSRFEGAKECFQRARCELSYAIGVDIGDGTRITLEDNASSLERVSRTIRTALSEQNEVEYKMNTAVGQYRRDVSDAISDSAIKDQQLARMSVKSTIEHLDLMANHLREAAHHFSSYSNHKYKRY